MAELLAKPATWGLTAVEKAGVTLAPLDMEQITGIALFPSRREGALAALKTMGLGWPAPGRLTQADDLRLVWAGRNEALLFGAFPEGLADLAAITDQSGAFAGLSVAGNGAKALLARLLPLDLRPRSLPPGSAARSLAGHIPALLLHREPDLYQLYVPRSMIASFWHEIRAAQDRLAARQKA